MGRIFLSSLFVCSVAFSHATSILREMDVHMKFLRQSSSAGKVEICDASADLVAPQVIRVSLSGNLQPDRVEAVTRAMAIWEDVLDGDVRFLITDESDAEVKIFLLERLEMKGRALGGYAFWSRSIASLGATYEARLESTVYLAEGYRNQSFSAEARVQAALHELGHVLGLDDGGNGVMAALDPANPISMPSRQEVQAILRLRMAARSEAISSRRLLAQRTK